MTYLRFLSGTLRSFTESSKSLAKAVHKQCRRRRLSIGFFCVLSRISLGRRGEIPRESKNGRGITTTTLSELMKLREEEDGKRQYDKERGILKLERKEKEAGQGAEAAMLEEVKERERRVKEMEGRVKASYQALARLIEVEVMEASDVEQVLDLNEVLSNYPFITNHFLLDLINAFILDVSNRILSSS